MTTETTHKTHKPSPIEGRPAAGSTIGPDGMPTAYIIFCTSGRSTAYCWEIEHAGVGVTGNNQAECLATWLDEYKDETGKAFQPAPPARKQLSLAF